MKLKLSAVIAAIGTLAGCASLSADVDTTRFDTMSCAEIDSATTVNSEAISQIAIDRTRTARLSIPQWLFGASKAVDVVNERRTLRIERLQQEQAALKAARQQNCPQAS